VRKVGSRGEFVFVEESAEAVATLDARWGWRYPEHVHRGRCWGRQVQRAVRPVGVVVVDEDAENALEMAPVHDQEPVEALGAGRCGRNALRTRSPWAFVSAS
jgi:hypothetical protein